MSDRPSTKPPSGMRDFLPVDIARRRHVIDVVESVYRRHGFVPLETPTIENLTTLLGKYGDEGDQLLYRVLRRRDDLQRVVDAAASEGRPAAERDLAKQGLRYDLTVPLARVVAQYDLPRLFKRYQIQPVWRADRPGKGRFREFYQCDVDVTGTESVVAEAEVCGAVAEVLERLGFDAFEIRCNHRELLRALIRGAGIPESLEATALVAVDKLDKIGSEGVVAELAERGIAADSARSLLASIAVGDESNDARLDHLRARVDDGGGAALDDLAQLLELTTVNAAGRHLRVTPSLARGLSYYTGPIFEIAVPDLAGSLGGGGRYDGLIGMFGKRSVPAVGFSLGLERILVVMEQRDMYPSLRVGPQVLLCWVDVDATDVLRVARRLRDEGLSVEVYPEPTKLKKQLQYANAPGVGVPFVAILGSSERDAGLVRLKDLRSGEQQDVAPVDAARIVRETTSSR